jgi:hypothetical protein
MTQLWMDTDELSKEAEPWDKPTQDPFDGVDEVDDVASWDEDDDLDELEDD